MGHPKAESRWFYSNPETGTAVRDLQNAINGLDVCGYKSMVQTTSGNRTAVPRKQRFKKMTQQPFTYFRSPTDNVPLAAIQGLIRLLTELDKIDKDFDRELVAISQKIRPYMNTECSQLRENSIRLFGIVASKINSEALVEQAVGSLPCFLLHLCDNNPAVVRVSKTTDNIILHQYRYSTSLKKRRYK